MKKITYTMKFLSSTIVSPRAGQAFYYGIDTFCREPVLCSSDPKEAKTVKVVYPFYQYGMYEKYDPDHAEYYLPGSSVKGALLQKNDKKIHIMADDIPVAREQIVLKNLEKAQYVDEYNDADFKLFFGNVGVEMLKAGSVLSGDLYLEDDIAFEEILEDANSAATAKISQMCRYLETLMKNEYKSVEFKKELKQMLEKLYSLEKRKSIILIGGYKGLLHSILLKADRKTKKRHENSEKGRGIFLDRETDLPHGLASIRCESEVQIL